MKKTPVTKHGHGCQKGPKWSPNQCKNASTIDTKTGSEKYWENNEKSCFIINILSRKLNTKYLVF